jgi:hypothetical protein
VIASHPLLLLAASLVALPLAAQAADPGAGKAAHAARLAGPAPHIDGRLDEPLWSSASWISDFHQKDPVEGGTPTDRTEVAFYYDDDALYVGARLWSTRVAEIPRPVTRRDQYSNAEYFIVSLDPYHDKRTGYSFNVSSGGVQGDSYHPYDNEDDRDPAFNPVWQARISFDSAGWYVEMRIPFSQLRFNSRASQTWGLNINRWRPAFNEDVYWVVIPRALSGFFSHFGTLEGLDGVHATRRAEFIPYAASTGTFSGAPAAGNPFDDGSEFAGRLGADFKVGLGPNLTLDGTVNPDFGQVEADPAEVNLTAFETFFPEQRPFFIEGNQLLAGNGPGYYYSRRIGGPPHGGATADFVDIPNHATILGAAKLTGRTASGLSLGALAALTQREIATTYDTSTAAFGRVVVEPRTGYVVARAQQEFGASASTIGVTLTGLSRSLAGAGPLANQVTDQAASGGADWLLRMSQGKYQVSGHAGFSYVHGSASALTGIQESSAHYFQRPDQRHALLDPGRTSLAGYSASLFAEKAEGLHWTGGLGAAADSPGFELNDVGRLQSADDIDANGWVNYRENTEGALFRRYRLGLSASSGWNFGGTRTRTSYRLNTNQTWKNWWNSYLGAWFNPRSTSDDLTRGGPLMGTGRQTGLQMELSTNEANAYRGGGNLTLVDGEFGRSSQSVGLNLVARPGSRWQVSLTPTWRHSVNPRQYAAVVDGGGAATFGARYVFATVDQTTLSMQVRLNYSFTPVLTLEAYAEPFASSGAFTRHGELTAAGASALRTYGTDNTTIARDSSGNYVVSDAANGQVFGLANNDFNVLSYRSNVVLRWEWRPGSALFLVWQQNRASDCSAGFDTGACHQADRTPGSGVDVGDLLASRRVPGDNILVVKASYWLSVR